MSALVHPVAFSEFYFDIFFKSFLIVVCIVLFPSLSGCVSQSKEKRFRANNHRSHAAAGVTAWTSKSASGEIVVRG